MAPVVPAGVPCHGDGQPLHPRANRWQAQRMAVFREWSASIACVCMWGGDPSLLGTHFRTSLVPSNSDKSAHVSVLAADGSPMRKTL